MTDFTTLIKALGYEADSAADPQARINGVANVDMLESLANGGEGQHDGAGLTYYHLKMMCSVPLVSSIINTRVNQIAEFGVPCKSGDSIGFQIRLREQGRAPTALELETIEDVYRFMEGCGDPRLGSDVNFEGFLRMLVRDSLVYDQATFEIIYSDSGSIAGFQAVDSTTIRRAKMDAEDRKSGRRDPGKIQFVQRVDDKIVAEFTGNQLCFGVRRPRTELKFRGYGFPELVECVGLITSLVNADTFNAANFTNGINVNGILAIKSKMNPQMFRTFRKEFYNMLSGVSNAKKTPLIQLDPDSKEGLESVDLGKSNRDMEFAQWQQYLQKMICAVFQIDPIEIGLKFGNEGQTSSLSEGSGESRLASSKDKGLRPLLRAVQSWINQYIIRQLDEELEFVFTGMDSTPAEKQLDMDVKKVSSFMTVNELRKQYDLPELPGGDIILNPVYAQAIMLAGGPATIGAGGNPAAGSSTVVATSAEGDSENE